MLRLLLSDGWRELEGNVARRSGTRSWNFTERNIVPYLQNIRDLNHNTFFSKVRFTQSYILKHHYLGWHSSGCGSSWHKLFWSQIRQKSKGIENVIELLKYFGQCRHIFKVGRCIFKSASMFNNNCDPNCVREIEDCTIRILAARSGVYIFWALLIIWRRDLCAGEELTLCYADTTLPTNIRQETFWITKQFHCTCRKCIEQWIYCQAQTESESQISLSSRRKKVPGPNQSRVWIERGLAI